MPSEPAEDSEREVVTAASPPIHGIKSGVVRPPARCGSLADGQEFMLSLSEATASDRSNERVENSQALRRRCRSAIGQPAIFPSEHRFRIKSLRQIGTPFLIKRGCQRFWSGIDAHNAEPHA